MGLGQFSQLKDMNINYISGPLFCILVLNTKSQVPQYRAYMLTKKSLGTKLTGESNYARRILDGREKGSDIKAREERQKERKANFLM